MSHETFHLHISRHSIGGIGGQLTSANPAAWGYNLDTPSGKYISVANPERPAVTLHLVGHKPDSVDLAIPAETEGVVILHSGLEYDDFYTLIASMYVPFIRQF